MSNASKLIKIAVPLGQKYKVLPSFVGAIATQESAMGSEVPANAPQDWYGWGVDTGSQGSVFGNKSLEWYTEQIERAIASGKSPFAQKGTAPVNCCDAKQAFYKGYWANSSYHTAVLPGDGSSVLDPILKEGFKKADDKVIKTMDCSKAFQTSSHLPPSGSGKGGGSKKPGTKPKSHQECDEMYNLFFGERLFDKWLH